MKSETDNRDFSRAAISRIVTARLKLRLADENSSAAATEHLDADTMAAFVEGRLDEAEARPLISHLVSCASCLHFTAELIRYESDPDDVPASVADESAGPLRRFFDRLATGAIPQFNEDTVFAYNEKDNESEEKKEPGADKPKSS